jgi:hypothetical protein
VTQIFHSGQPSRGCDRKPFEVVTNVHQPNSFAQKERIGYDYLCPHKKEKNDTNDVTIGYFFRRITMIDVSRGFKQVSLPRDFVQKS